MGGKSTSGQTTTQSQQSTSQGWAPAMDAMTKLMPRLNTAAAGAGGNAATNNAFANILNNAQSQPNYGAQAYDAANNMIGANGQSQTDMINQAYSKTQGALNPYMNANYTDPMSNPGMAGLLSRIQSDVTNQISGGAAAAGRTGSGYENQNLARGLSEGMSAPLLQAYQQNVQNQLNAAGQYSNNASSAAQQLQNIQQQGFGNTLQGLQLGSQLAPQIQNAGNQGILDATLGQQAFDAQALSPYLGIFGNAAGLGQTSSGSSNSNTQGYKQASPMEMAQGWTNVAGNVAKMMWPGSDIRLKHDIAKVGELFDGTPVYRFRYNNGDQHMQIGLMAQDVEKYAPDAVAEIDGFKHVDYVAATNRALEMK